MAGRDQPAPSRADAAEPLTGGEAASVPGSVWLSNLCGPRQNADPKRARSAVTPAPVSKIKNRMWRQYGPGRLLHHCALCCAQALRRGRWHCSMIVVRPSRADLPQRRSRWDAAMGPSLGGPLHDPYGGLDAESRPQGTGFGGAAPIAKLDKIKWRKVPCDRMVLFCSDGSDSVRLS